MNSHEPVFEVVSPIGTRGGPTSVALAPRLGDLSGKRIAFIWDNAFRGDEMVQQFQRAVKEKFGEVDFVGPLEFGNFHGPKDEADEAIALLPERLAEHRIDGAIVGVGACGSCTPATLRTAATVERAGVPAVSLISHEFATMGALIARVFGVEGTPLALYPGPGVIMADPDDTFEAKVRDSVVPGIFAGLMETPPQSEERSDSTGATGHQEVVLRASYSDFVEEFLSRNWTDGLPVIPPTLERVNEFLSYTDHGRDEVLGLMMSSNLEATVWSVAVNGVMAGCRPEYMPVLVAVAAAAADRNFGIEDAGSTPGWEPLISVSGPIVEELKFNSAAGAMRVGNQANTSIGRFLRLYMRNVGGLRPYPDESDKGAISYTFNVALAENEPFTTSIGWQPHRVDRGYELGESAITVRSVTAISAPIYSAGERAEQHLKAIAKLTADALGPWAAYTYFNQGQNPLIVIGPAIAEAIARDGFSKDDVRQFLYENVVLDADWVQEYGSGVSGRQFDWNELVDQGKAPEEYRDAATKKLKVRGILRPDAIDIVVAGNPGRNQSRAYITNQNHGTPTSKRVDLPKNWDELRNAKK